jgi:hypothetical protein
MPKKALRTQGFGCIVVGESLPSGRRRSMPFFCYIHRRGSDVPHLEVLPETTERGAAHRAAGLLEQRADAVRAEVWDGDSLLFTLGRERPDGPATRGP